MEVNGIKLDSFSAAYLECALWCAQLDDSHDFFDVPADVLRSIVADCAAFQEENGDALADLPSDSEQDGHDFYLTREGHGAGFWDRGYGPIGNTISDAARAYGTDEAFTEWALNEGAWQ